MSRSFHLPHPLLVLACLAFAATASPANAAPPDGTGNAAQENDKRETPGLSKGEIQAVIRAHIAEVRSCYNTVLIDAPEASGRSVFTFRIGQAGEVVESSVTQSDMPKSMDTCVNGALRRWRFPAPSTGSVSVTYPFVFEPS